MKLLLVEDEPLLGAGLRAALGKAGFAVTWTRTGVAALDQLDGGEFAAMVLATKLPDMSGLDVLCKLRSKGNRLPVLVLSAGGTTRDKVVAFDSGADDYLLKTADMEELSARLRALIRRAGRENRSLSVGDLKLDLDSRLVSLEGKNIAVSGREFSALRTLLESVGRVLTRSQLEASVYGWNQMVESNAIEVHIHNLRHKLGTHTIRTVRGVGYTVAAPVS
jgi:two-component system response regulator QseB